MLLKKKTVPADSASPKAQAPQSERPGWDPFEVWRTRVLLPRLEGDQGQNKPPPAVQLVRK